MNKRILKIFICLSLSLSISSCNVSESSSVDEFTISFNKNSKTATGEMANIKLNNKEILTIPQNAYLNPGYIFKSWNTQTNGSGITYKSQSKITLSKDLTLYAQWEKVKQSTLTISLFDSGERILRSSSITNNKSINIYSAKNEYISFQISLKSSKDITINEITPYLSNEYKSTIYREHQLELKNGSKQNFNFAPGWYPDALIPVKNTLTGEELKDSRFDALPYLLKANETHTFWIDINVPYNSSSGNYQLKYKITTDQKIEEIVTVDLNVWDFSIPETTSIPTIFGEPVRFINSFYQKTGNTFYNNLDDNSWSKISENVNTLIRENRLSTEITFYDFWVGVDETTSKIIETESAISTLENFIETNKPSTMEVPIGRSNSLKQIVFNDAYYNYHNYNPNDFDQNAKTRLISYISSWDNFLDRVNNNNTLFYLYLCDEPRGSEKSYDYVRDLGKVIKNLNLKNIKILVVEQIEPDTPGVENLEGAVDIWCPSFSQHNNLLTDKRRNQGELVFTYTAMDHKDRPNWILDFPLTHYKLPFWINYTTTSADGFLYWGLTVWSEIPTLDPWTDQRSWSHGPGDYLNGDGSLLYPGFDVGLPYSAVPSMRLKMLRDSLEEYEYFLIAENMGLESQVKELINSVASSWYSWTDNNQKLKEVKIAIGELISNN